MAPPRSLNALAAAEAAGSCPDGSSGGRALSELLADGYDGFAVVRDHDEAVQIRRWVQRATAALPAREALVIRRHLRGRTLRQIGAELRVTEARACQLRKRAIVLLREQRLGDPRLVA